MSLSFPKAQPLKSQGIPANNPRLTILLYRKGRISLYLLLLLILGISFPVFSQDLSRKITIKAKNILITDILNEISRQGQIYFSYNPQLIPDGARASVKVVDLPISTVLDKLLIPVGIDYKVVENQVVLKKHTSEEIREFPLTGKIPRHSLNGFVRERSTGEMLIGANIFIREISRGVVSNGYGFYSLTLQEGKYTVVCSYLGFVIEVREIKLDGNISLSFDLTEAPTEMKEVEITATGKSSESRNNQLSELSFSHRTLAQLPGFGGNVDIIRALQVIPGIQTFGDGSSLYYVRGGNSDQNLLLIDDVPVYNPSHLFGFFSAFSPDAVNDVKIFKGEFPAKYGGKLSSVIDIKVKEGNMKRLGFSGNIGPYASSLTFEGPILKERLSFFLSGRISTLNWLTGITGETSSLDFIFYDFHAKLNYIVDKRNRIFVTFYTGKDTYNQSTSSSYQTYGISWNNLVGALRWNHVFNTRLFSNVTLNYSQYNYFLFISKQQDDFWNSSVSNMTGKADLSWYLNPSNTLRAGLEVSSHYSNPGNVILADGSSQQQPAEVPRYHSMEYDLYLGNEQAIGKKLLLRYGVRLPVWQDFGPTTVYYFNVNFQVSDTISMARNKSYATFFRLEPRLSCQYSFNDGSMIKAGYSRTTQFMQILTNSTSPFTTPAVWVPAGPNIQPQVADQVSCGYFRKIVKSILNLSAEVYYKYYNQNLDYKDHANLLYNPLLEGELRPGKAWSYGVELMLRKTEGKFTGWIGYTFSRAFIKTEGVNGDKTYPASYDRPNDFCLNLSYADRKHWTLTANWIYLSGGAITTPIGFYYNNGSSVPIYGDKNNNRLPAYHRLDLSACYSFNKPGNRYQHSLIITLYNVYGRFNPFSVNFNKMITDNGEFVVPSNVEAKNQLIPTTISVAGLIPSINYQFRFQ
jgi:outer membrane cobalamin receptor